jgi:hypothetical protein
MCFFRGSQDFFDLYSILSQFRGKNRKKESLNLSSSHNTVFACLPSKVCEKCYYDKKIKNAFWVSKNAEFDADFESAKNICKKIHAKKDITEKVTGKGSF